MSSNKSDEIIWVIDKENDYWGEGVFHHKSIDLPPFYKTYIWYIIFVTIWALLFFRERVIRSYKYPETLMAIIGLFFGVIILAFFDYFEFYAPRLFFDGKTHKLFKAKNIIMNKTMVLINDTVGLIKDKKNDANAYSSDYIKKLENDKKIKTISLSEWADQQDYNYDMEDVELKDSSNLWFVSNRHFTFTTILLLTMSFIIAIWDRKIFRKTYTWISITLMLEILVGATWVVSRTYKGVANTLYIIKKLQIIVSGLSITTMLLFMGLAFKK